MSAPLVDRIPFAKIVTVLGVICVVSVGLCGAGVAFSASSYRAEWLGHFSGFMLVSGIASFWGSLLGLFLMGALWLILTIAKG